MKVVFYVTKFEDGNHSIVAASGKDKISLAVGSPDQMLTEIKDLQGRLGSDVTERIQEKDGVRVQFEAEISLSTLREVLWL